MYLTLISLLLASSSAEHYERECNQIEDEGFYCTADLKRVHDCVYDSEHHDFYLGLRNEITCPEGTRCSCSLDYPCPSNKTSDICKPFENIAPFVESFAMAYSWHRFHRSYNPHHPDYANYEERKEGEISRDIDEGRFYKKVGSDVELVEKKGDELFTKYKWNDGPDNNCKMSQLTYLPSFDLHNLGKYQFLSSTKVGDKIQQKWYLQTGRNSWAYDFYKRTLTVLYDPASNRMIPQKYYEEWIEGEGDYDHFTTITWSQKKTAKRVSPPANCA